MMTQTDKVRIVAEKIADELFSDGNNHKAQRLVAEMADTKYGGAGWSYSAAVERIIKTMLKKNEHFIVTIPKRKVKK